MKQNKTKGFQKKKKKKTLEREIENERGPYSTTVTRDLQQRRGKKNSIIERDIKILPYLINRGGVGAGRRKSLGFDERERETETRGIREQNTVGFWDIMWVIIVCNKVY